MRAALLIGLAAVLAVVGCGGGGGDTVVVTTSPSAAPLSKPEYIAKVDSICAQYRPERDRLRNEAQALGSVSSPEVGHQAADVVNRSADSLAEEVKQIQAVPAPVADRQVLDTLFSTLNGVVVETHHVADAYESVDSSQIRALEPQVISDNEKAKGIATGYGFKVCGQD